MKGRGITSCLICDYKVEFAVINNYGILYGINLLYETYKVKQFHNFSQSFRQVSLLFRLFQYNIMLQDTKICVKCAGRLHQLFDFNLIKSNFDSRLGDAIMNKNCCYFCEDGEPMKQEFKEIVEKAVTATKWAKVSSEKLFSFKILIVNF